MIKDIISTRRLAELKFAVDSSLDAIVVATWGGIITTWNKAAEIMYGYAGEEVMGCSIAILHPPDKPDELSRLHGKLEQGESIVQSESVWVRKDGTQILVSLTLSPMKDAAGKIVSVAWIGSDITARKRAKAELQQDRAAVAHRLHDGVLQSLTAISLHLKAAQNLLTQNPPMAQQHLEKIESVLSDEQQNLRFFVSELKGGRLAKPMDDPSGMAKLEKLVKRLESQWSVRIEFDAEPGTSWIPTLFVEDLTYIIQEAVSNAVRHGHASIVRLQIGHAGEKLVVRITDDGCGFRFRFHEVKLTGNVAGPRMLRSRIAGLGCLLNIRSADSGACLEIILPLSRLEAADADLASSYG
jgi:PAS domain S-box-containing protein